MSHEIELERARISAILGHEHAKALPTLANALATGSDMSAEVAVSLLGAAMRDRDAAALAHTAEVDRLRKDFGAPRAGALGLGYAESTETKPTSQESVASWGKHVAQANKAVGDGGHSKPDPHGWGKTMRNVGVA
ncbi:hypothetical protein QBK99_05325 [Corticibacterium sp. UT-5YL-CI-8]|nr:hypothetical protein [Tianweitania sp. UT-5YL-CI-8]